MKCWHRASPSCMLLAKTSLLCAWGHIGASPACPFLLCQGWSLVLKLSLFWESSEKLVNPEGVKPRTLTKKLHKDVGGCYSFWTSGCFVFYSSPLFFQALCSYKHKCCTHPVDPVSSGALFSRCDHAAQLLEEVTIAFVSLAASRSEKQAYCVTVGVLTVAPVSLGYLSLLHLQHSVILASYPLLILGILCTCHLNV